MQLFLNEERILSLATYAMDSKDEKVDAVSIFNQWVDKEKLRIQNVEEVSWALNFISSITSIDNEVLDEAFKIDKKRNKSIKIERGLKL